MVLSPDGGLLAYTSADPAAGGLGVPVSEVQLRSFPEPGARTLVAGGLGAFAPVAWEPRVALVVRLSGGRHCASYNNAVSASAHYRSLP
jgi:hypothetical protein